MSRPLWEQLELPTLLAHELMLPAKPQWSRVFAPELSYGRHAGPARSDARGAAVAVVLSWDGAEWSLPLTVRSAELSRHGGQISFPGGLMEAGESPFVAAERELHEELGVRPPLEWLGILMPQFVYASNAWVVPCVAATLDVPAWQPNPREVERVLRLSLRELLAPPIELPLQVTRGPLRFAAPQLRVEGHSAWGATAVMLGELRGRLLRLDGNT
ncbi:NUDIX hydrolase [Lacipirellula sp.]|uniref:NUDIX hydrolase n=1 Tax=Lacipirellula sp. TaxID=2691419 RepID=UPI003D0A7C5F